MEIFCREIVGIDEETGLELLDFFPVAGVNVQDPMVFKTVLFSTSLQGSMLFNQSWMYFLLFILEVPEDDELDISDSAHELFISAMLAVSRTAGLLGIKDVVDINVCWDFNKLSEDFFGFIAGVKLMDGGNAGTAAIVVDFTGFFNRLVVEALVLLA